MRPMKLGFENHGQSHIFGGATERQTVSKLAARTIGGKLWGAGGLMPGFANGCEGRGLAGDVGGPGDPRPGQPAGLPWCGAGQRAAGHECGGCCAPDGSKGTRRGNEDCSCEQLGSCSGATEQPSRCPPPGCCRSSGWHSFFAGQLPVDHRNYATHVSPDVDLTR